MSREASSSNFFFENKFNFVKLQYSTRNLEICYGNQGNKIKKLIKNIKYY